MSMLINALLRTSFFSALVSNSVTEMGLDVEEDTGQTGGSGGEFGAGCLSS